MRIIRDIDHCPDDARHSIMALGNFDGVHRGHQAILKHCVDMAQADGLSPAVMTFEPHPRAYFSQNKSPVSIYTLRQKLTCLERAGIELVFLLRFNARLAGMPASEFIEAILHRSLGVSHVMTGYNFAFGKGRSGNTQFLAQEAARLGFGFTALPAVTESDTVISTSAIRAALAAGDMRQASHMLGHAYHMEGRVVEGERRGRAIGFPTANIRVSHLYTPRYGVYAVRAHLGNLTFHGVANLGIKPTFAHAEPLLEVHLFDCSSMLYGKRLRVELLHFIRPEQAFTDIEALKIQIAQDARQAKTLLETL